MCLQGQGICQSFAFVISGTDPAGKNCLLLDVVVSTPGIYDSVGNITGNYLLYDAACEIAPAANPVPTASKVCNVTMNYDTSDPAPSTSSAYLGDFYSATIESCRDFCLNMFGGYCGSYAWRPASNICYLMTTTASTSGTWNGLGTSGSNNYYVYDAGCSTDSSSYTTYTPTTTYTRPTVSATPTPSSCGVKSNGPTTQGWLTAGYNFPASSWEECYWICATQNAMCESFAYATNGAMAAGQECIMMKATIEEPGIWDNVGASNGDFLLYDATCQAPEPSNPVPQSSQFCNNTMSGGPSYDPTISKDGLIGYFYAPKQQDCKNLCTRYGSSCGSWAWIADSSKQEGYKIHNCYIVKGTLESAGTYAQDVTDSTSAFTASDAGCA